MGLSLDVDVSGSIPTCAGTAGAVYCQVFVWYTSWVDPPRGGGTSLFAACGRSPRARGGVRSD